MRNTLRSSVILALLLAAMPLMLNGCFDHDDADDPWIRSLAVSEGHLEGVIGRYGELNAAATEIIGMSTPYRTEVTITFDAADYVVMAILQVDAPPANLTDQPAIPRVTGCSGPSPELWQTDITTSNATLNVSPVAGGPDNLYEVDFSAVLPAHESPNGDGTFVMVEETSFSASFLMELE